MNDDLIIYDESEQIYYKGSSCYHREVKPQGILNLLETLPYTSDVKARADAFFLSKFSGTVRGDNRRAIAFICMYVSLREDGVSIDMKILMRQFGLTQKQINGALQTYYSLIPQYVSTPMDLIPCYMSRLCFDTEILTINEMAKGILERSRNCFINTKPRIVALAILYYYLVCTRRTSPKGKFCSEFMISEPQLNDALRVIEDLETFKE